MPTALIIIDHGSKSEAANAMLENLADMLRTMTSWYVYPAHMDLAEPTLAMAFAAAVSEGADAIIVFPYFLSPGVHSRQDIPRLCAEAAAGYKDLQWHCTGPIGLDPLLAELILRRVQLCESNQWQCPQCPDVNYCHAPDAES